MNWLAHLARLGHDDLKRISRMVDLLTTADRARADQARAMLSAGPEPETAHDARERLESIVGYLETH